MTAILFDRRRSLSTCRLREPEADAGSVLVRMESVCLTDTDLDAFYYGRGPLPRIFGSVGIGRVVAPREKVRVLPIFAAEHRGFVPGSLVAVDLSDSGEGTLQELVSAPIGRCYPIRSEIPVEKLPMLPDLAKAVGAIAGLELSGPAVIMIYGARTGGVLLALAAQHAGHRVILADPSSVRLTQARELGVEATVNPLRASIPEELDWFSADRADVILDTSGNPEVMPTARAIARPGTQIVLAQEMNYEISLADIVAERLTVRSLDPVAPDYETAANLAPDLPLDQMISLQVPLSEIPAAVRSASRERGAFMRLAAYM